MNAVAFCSVCTFPEGGAVAIGRTGEELPFEMKPADQDPGASAQHPS